MKAKTIQLPLEQIRTVLALFGGSDFPTLVQVRGATGLQYRDAIAVCERLVKDGYLVKINRRFRPYIRSLKPYPFPDTMPSTSSQIPGSRIPVMAILHGEQLNTVAVEESLPRSLDFALRVSDSTYMLATQDMTKAVAGSTLVCLTEGGEMQLAIYPLPATSALSPFGIVVGSFTSLIG